MNASEYKMTRKTAEKILRELGPDGRKAATLKKAMVRFADGTRRERFTMTIDGIKITSAADWKAYNTSAGFTRLSVAALHA
jgi:hypothetical protein